MAKQTSIKELRNMKLVDLLKEIQTQKELVTKMHMEIAMAKEKNTGRYQQERKQLAKMETVATEKRLEEKTSPSTQAA